MSVYSKFKFKVDDDLLERIKDFASKIDLDCSWIINSLDVYHRWDSWRDDLLFISVNFPNDIIVIYRTIEDRDLPMKYWFKNGMLYESHVSIIYSKPEWA